MTAILARPPPPPASRTPPPQAGEETSRATLQELSDGLERSMKVEGANIAPESPHGLEDKEKMVPVGGSIKRLLYYTYQRFI
jgi:hypothetical protein